ncbi:MAG: hypothetical protein WA751_06720 [Candidatus Dormiibacterota bacterium]
MSSEAVLELHLVSRRADHRAWHHLRTRSEAGARLEVVLLHDAVLETEATVTAALGETEMLKVTVMACTNDATQRKVEERWALIDYAGIIARSVAADQVTSW